MWRLGVDLLAKFGGTPCPVKAGRWPPPSAARGLDGARRSAAVCHQGIVGEVCPRRNFKPLDFNEFRTAVDNYPTVPRGHERLRITPSPRHSDELMDHLVEVLTDVWDQFKLPRSDRIVPVTKLRDNRVHADSVA